ncbi:3448_t:CDS:2, partial [Gigaspora rosea]
DDFENESLNDVIEICPHLKDAVKIPKLKKNLKNGSTNLMDAQCRKCISQDEGVQETLNSEEEEVLPQMWLCLACGKLHCSRYDKKHAIQHFEENGSHSIIMKLDATETWCYSCDKVVITSYGKNQVINQARNFILKVLKSGSFENNDIRSKLG